jgi:aspartate/tyrosine/aromatic aminotransferase
MKIAALSRQISMPASKGTWVNMMILVQMQLRAAWTSQLLKFLGALRSQNIIRGTLKAPRK